MKTTINITLAISVLLAASCAKSEIQEKDTINNIPDIIPAKTVTLKAYADESLLTKSNYTLSGGEYLFEWVENDKFIVQTYDGSSAYSSDVFTASTGGSPKVEFTGSITDGFDKATYAFYPNDGTAGSYNFKYKNIAISPVEPSSTERYGKDLTATIHLPLEIVENKDYPWAHIPMIGIKDSNGDYSFSPIAGVFKFTVKNLPSTATKVRLKTNSTYNSFSGDFVFDTNNEVRLNYGTSSSEGDIQLSITSSGSDSNRTFYFPVPTGTLGAGTYDFYVENNGNWWRQGSPKVDLTVVKGQVIELPPVTYHETRVVSIVGTITAPAIHMDFPTGEKMMAKIEDSADATSDYSQLSFSKANDSWTIESQYLPSSSGTYYLHYKIVNKDDTSDIRQFGKIEFYYLKPLSVSVSGTSSDPKITLESIVGYDDIRAILTSLPKADALAKLDASRSTPDTDVLQVSTTDPTSLITTSLTTGKYSLYVKGYNDTKDASVDASNSIYYLTESDKGILEGNYTHTVESGCVAGHPGADAPSTSNFTLAECTNPTVGHMMVTIFDGMSFVQNVPGIYTPATNRIEWDNYKTYFDPNDPYKRFLRSSGASTKLGFIFNISANPVSFYADAGFGYKQGTGDAGGWQYYYNAGSGHVYTKQ